MLRNCYLECIAKLFVLSFSYINYRYLHERRHVMMIRHVTHAVTTFLAPNARATFGAMNLTLDKKLHTHVTGNMNRVRSSKLFWRQNRVHTVAAQWLSAKQMK